MARLATGKAMAFVVAPDREAAKAFYGGTLGLPLTHEDAFACVFDLNGTALRLSSVPGFRPQSHTVLGWKVADIRATITALREAGVVFTVHDGMGQDDLGIWRPPGGGTQVAWFTDPAGNVLSLTQFG